MKVLTIFVPFVNASVSVLPEIVTVASERTIVVKRRSVSVSPEPSESTTSPAASTLSEAVALDRFVATSVSLPPPPSIV